MIIIVLFLWCWHVQHLYNTPMKAPASPHFFGIQSLAFVLCLTYFFTLYSLFFSLQCNYFWWGHISIVIQKLLCVGILYSDIETALYWYLLLRASWKWLGNSVLLQSWKHHRSSHQSLRSFLCTFWFVVFENNAVVFEKRLVAKKDRKIPNLL